MGTIINTYMTGGHKILHSYKNSLAFPLAHHNQIILRDLLFGHSQDSTVQIKTYLYGYKNIVYINLNYFILVNVTIALDQELSETIYFK